MARDGFLLGGRAAVSRQADPTRALLIQAIWVSAPILFLNTFERLVPYTGFAVTIFAALAVAADMLLRNRRPPHATVPRSILLWLPSATLWRRCESSSFRSPRGLWNRSMASPRATELPIYFALCSARIFARGAVAINSMRLPSFARLHPAGTR